MADMDTLLRCFLPCCTGWSRGVRRPRWLPAATCNKNCKSSWGCGLVSVISMPYEQRMDGATLPARRKKNPAGGEANVQQGVGGLILLAAAHETGLLSHLETAIASCEP